MSIRRLRTSLLPLLMICTATAVTSMAGPAHAERIRDIAEIEGVRENQLIGYGIVTGLNGTGDDQRAPFAAQSVLSMLRRLGVQIDAKQVQLRNVAAVVVTANLPPFAKPGTKLDITVSSIGNAKSIARGVLVQTLLKGADQKTYAVAQGPLLVGGIKADGQSGSNVRQGSVTTARIPEGAIIEKEVPTSFASDKGVIKLQIRNPSFTVAARIAAAIESDLGKGTATATDGGQVNVMIPKNYKTKQVELIARLEDLDIETIRKARVVINERTDTIVAGGDVRLAPAAIVHGGLTIVVNEAPIPSQPQPFSQGGETVIVPNSQVEVQERESTMNLLPAAPTLADVASALGTLGLAPREMASVLQALKSAGALEAEVVVQ